MKLSGTILNARDYKPVEGAKITLTVQGKEIAKPATYSDGRYEYTTDKDYIGQTLTYVIEKDGFEKKTFSTIIDKPEIQKKFLFRSHEKKDKLAKLKGFGYGISIVMVALALLVIYQPQAELIQPDPIQNLTQNDMSTVNIQVTRVDFWNWPVLRGRGDVDWELRAEDEWVRFSKDGKTSKKISGTSRNSTETVHVTIFTPDYVLSPGERTIKIYLDNKNLDIFKFLRSGNYTLNDSANITFRLSDTKKRPKLEIELGTEIINGTLDTKDLENRYEIRIENIGTGTPWWSLRNDKAWIELWQLNKSEHKFEQYNSNERRFENGSVYFKILPEKLGGGKTVEGNITLGYNNDGKDKIHIFVCKANDTAIARIESWYLPDYYGGNVTPVSDMLPPDFCPN